MDGSTLSYEELEGAAGRKVFFRPKRFKASEIFERPQPQVSLNGQDWLIENVSLSGMALTSAGRTPASVAIGETCEVVITQCLHPLFEGRAVIRRIDESIRAPQIGISFVGDTLDVAQLLRADASARATARLDLLSSPRNAQVPEEYRLLCTDVLHMLKSYRSFLEGAPKEDAARMVEACLERMMPAWNEFWRRGNEITREAFPDAGQLRAIKELTELVLTPEFCHGAIWDRSYTKPLGYPGDFQVMNYVYDWQAVGETPYEQLVHRIGLDVAECIRTRMLLMEDTIEKEADAMPSGRETRVLSLGSGPAREVASLLKRSGGSNRNYEFTLIDQESEALQYAYENCFPEIASSATNSRLNCLNLSFLDVLRGHVEDDRARDQDIVYSLGLFDYLNDRRARRLASSLFDLLKPGGLMVIGNMNETEMSGLWPIECITDWRLYYRTDEEMCGWGEGLDAEACWTETEETDRVRLLFVRKRA